MNTDRFSITLTSVSANTVVTLLDLPQVLSFYQQFQADYIVEHSIILEDLQAKVGLFTLREPDLPDSNALASDAAQDAANAKTIKEGQKVYLELLIARGNGPWELQAEEALQNKNGVEQGWALMRLMSTNETALLGESLKIGVRIANKAQGTGGLKGSDYIRIFGTWRKSTKIEPKKKDNGVGALQNRIAALETLLTTFGAPSASLPGSSGLVPAPPAGSGEFLLRGDRAWQDASKFALSEQLILKAPLTNPSFIGFVGLGNNVAIQKKYFLIQTAAQEGENAILLHGLNLAKIRSVDIQVEVSSSLFMPPSMISVPGYCFSYYLTTTLIYIQNVNLYNFTSNLILNKPLHITIEYVE